MPTLRRLALRASTACALAVAAVPAHAAPRPRDPPTAPASAAADPGSAGPESARLETLPGPPADGVIRTPEGFIRLEGPAAPDDGTRGAFGVYRPRPAPPARAEAAAPATAGAGSSAAPGGREPPPAPATQAWPVAPAAPDPCRAERSRYLRHLLRSAGIDLPDPLALAENLAGPYGSAPWLVYGGYGIVPAVDPVRPLAWDLELRSLARDLAACAR